MKLLNTSPCLMSMAVTVFHSYDALAAKTSSVVISKTNARSSWFWYVLDIKSFFDL